MRHPVLAQATRALTILAVGAACGAAAEDAAPAPAAGLVAGRQVANPPELFAGRGGACARVTWDLPPPARAAGAPLGAALAFTQSCDDPTPVAFAPRAVSLIMDCCGSGPAAQPLLSGHGGATRVDNLVAARSGRWHLTVEGTSAGGAVNHFDIYYRAR